MSVTASPDTDLAGQIQGLMKRRRVCRSYTGEPVADDDLRRLTEAARWATSAGNRHLHKFLIVRDPAKIHLIRAVAPGMLVVPPAVIVILTDTERARQESMQANDHSTRVDVGTAAQNMMNLAQALGLGTCPVTSFSRSGLAVMLDLPPHLIPEFMLMVGHPAPAERVLRANAPKPITARELTYWEEAGRHEP